MYRRTAIIAFMLFLTTEICLGQTDSIQSSEATQTPQFSQAIFPGGNEGFSQYIKDNLEYPEEAMENEIGGKAYIQFVVDTLGNVTDVEVVEINLTKKETVVVSTKRIRKTRTHKVDFESENDFCLGTCAANLISNSPQWKPATLGDKKVKVRYRIPIRYEIY